MHSFKINNIKKVLIINEQGGITADQIYRKYKPDWFCNLALYDNETKTNITLLEADNKTSGYLFTPDGIGIKNDKDLSWCTYEQAKAGEEICCYVSGSPVLMRNNKKVKDFGNKYSFYVDQYKHMRTMIGLTTSKELILSAFDYNIGLELARDMVKDKHKDLAYLLNCDGGGSVHLQHKTKKYVSSGRKNASWLLVWEEDLIQEGDDEVVTKKPIQIDGAKKECDVIIKNGRTYVQLREFESAGYTVNYVNGVATIDKPKK